PASCTTKSSAPTSTSALPARSATIASAKRLAPVCALGAAPAWRIRTSAAVTASARDTGNTLPGIIDLERMRRSSWLLAAGTIVYRAVALSAPAPAATAPASSYVGSEACRRCHEPEYETWRQNLHVQMTKPIAEARVEGDFSGGAALDAAGRRY